MDISFIIYNITEIFQIKSSDLQISLVVMATAQNRNKKRRTLLSTFDSPVKRGFAIVTGFIVVAGMGYSVATIQKNIEFKLEKIELNQECNEKIESKSNECRAAEQQLVNKKVDDLESVLKDLKKKLDAK